MINSARAAGFGCAVMFLAVALFWSDQILLTWCKVEDVKAYAGLSVASLSAVVEKLDSLAF